MSAARAVGVFDSGIGGLTVVRELVHQLPNESVIYFGDTARVPYGPKSPDTVRRYSREIASFLIGEDVKAIVIACNTATAHALATLRHMSAMPVIGVIEPGARAATRVTRGHIGVIGTAGTIRSGAYERAIRDIDPDIRVTSRACPVLVPLVEEGWLEHNVTKQVIDEYLAPLLEGGVDTIVLGCTHYPLLKPLLCRAVGAGVNLIDSAAETAAELCRVLEDRSLRASNGNAPRHRFVASDDPLQFLQLGQRFLGDTIESVDVHTFA